MVKTITKINNLVNAESFLQVNFVKGYKYVDRAGEIVNYFHTSDKKAPNFVMNLQGLIINNPDEKTEEIKISPNSFWAHFVSPDSLEIMNDFFDKKSEDIIKILEIEEISRIGWRNFFVQEFNNEDERDSVLKKFAPIENLEFGESLFTTECLNFQLNIRIKKVIKNEANTTPGVLIDVDFYRKFETDNLLTTDKLKIELLDFKKVIRSDEFLEIIKNILA